MRSLWLLTLITATAGAQPSFGVRAATGLAVPVTQLQRDAFGPGWTGAVTPFVELLPMLDVQLTASMVVLPGSGAQVVSSEGLTLGAQHAGGAGSVLAGVRLKRPMVDRLVQPWADVGVGAGLSGNASLALGGSVGVALRPTESLPVLFGLFAHLEWLSRPGVAPGFVSSDALLASFGVSVEFAPASVERDHDHDGVPDDADWCPEDAGDRPDGCPSPPPRAPAPVFVACDGHVDATGACIPYQGVHVTPRAIELDEKLFFAFGKTTLMPRSLPLVAEVAKALVDAPSLCVRVEGHADARGSDAFNQTLSEGRASAVREQLQSHGVAAERLTSKGYGASLPRDDNRSADGRDQNRRVEFVIVPCDGVTP